MKNARKKPGIMKSGVDTTPLFLQDDLLTEDFKCSPSNWLISSFTSKLVVKSANGRAYGQFARGQKNDLPGKP